MSRFLLKGVEGRYGQNQTNLTFIGRALLTVLGDKAFAVYFSEYIFPS